MASRICNDDDANHGTNDNDARLEKEGSHDRTHLSQSDCTHWLFLQLESDLRKCHVSLPERIVYTDAQGKYISPNTFMIASSRESKLTLSQATTPVAVLLATWGLGVEPVNLQKLGNVSFIVIGVIIASLGEIKFQLVGFIFQVGGIIFEAIRLVMVQRLLSSAEFKMDPLVSLYYFAPVCAMMNGLASLLLEVPRMSVAEILNVGLFTFLLNAMVAFALNVSVVFLVCIPCAAVTICRYMNTISTA